MLNSAQNRVNVLKRTAEAQFLAARSSLLTHMQIPSVKIEDLLAAANTRRKLLGLTLLDQLTPDTRLDAGLTRLRQHSTSNRPYATSLRWPPPASSFPSSPKRGRRPARDHDYSGGRSGAACLAPPTDAG